MEANGTQGPWTEWSLKHRNEILPLKHPMGFLCSLFVYVDSSFPLPLFH